MGLKVDELAKALGFPIGEARLTTITVVHVFVARHSFCYLIGILSSAGVSCEADLLLSVA